MPPKKGIDRKNRIEERRKADDRFTWRVLGVMFFLTVWTILLYRFNWPGYIYAIPSGIAVLYLLAYIYPRDFTTLAVFISGGAFGLWILTELFQRSERWQTMGYMIFSAVLAVSASFFWLLRKNKGVVRLWRLKLIIMPQKAKYRYVFIACACLAASLLASILFGRTAAWGSLIAMFGYLFVMAVYYTVRLI